MPIQNFFVPLHTKSVKTLNIMDYNKIADRIAKSDFFKEYGYKGHWTSGCVTDVAPITIWVESNSIEIQLNCELNGVDEAFDKLVSELNEKVKNHYVGVYDGSCPNVAKIFF